MSRNTMSFALPENMRDYIDARVSEGSYGNTSEYLRELIRRDQREQAAQRLRNLLADGLASGEGREATDDVIDELRKRALGAEA
jgi:antitoxin ParD1/3/4